MDKNIAKEFSEYIFASVYKHSKNLTVAICINDTDFEKDTKKRQVTYFKVYGYSVENNSKLKDVTLAIIYTKENKVWTKKNTGKLLQKNKNFILVDKDNSAYMIACSNSDINNFDEKYLGQFSTDTLQYLCPNTIFVQKQPLNWFSALAESKSGIKFSKEDSIEKFNEKLEQKYNQLIKNLRRRIIEQIKNKCARG